MGFPFIRHEITQWVNRLGYSHVWCHQKETLFLAMFTWWLPASPRGTTELRLAPENQSGCGSPEGTSCCHGSFSILNNTHLLALGGEESKQPSAQRSPPLPWCCGCFRSDRTGPALSLYKLRQALLLFSHRPQPRVTKTCSADFRGQSQGVFLGHWSAASFLCHEVLFCFCIIHFVGECHDPFAF